MTRIDRASGSDHGNTTGPWDRLDRHLLLHFPWLWMVRAHHLLAGVAAAWLVATAAAALYPMSPASMPAVELHTTVLLVISTAGSVAWLFIVYRGQHGTPLRTGSDGWLAPLGVAAGLALLALPVLVYARVLDGRAGGLVTAEELRADSAAYAAVELPPVFTMGEEEVIAPFVNWSGGEGAMLGNAPSRPYIDEVAPLIADSVGRIGAKYTGLTSEEFIALTTLMTALRRMTIYETWRSSGDGDPADDVERARTTERLPTGDSLRRLRMILDACEHELCRLPFGELSVRWGSLASRSEDRLVSAGLHAFTASVEEREAWKAVLEAADVVPRIEGAVFAAFRSNVRHIVWAQEGGRTETPLSHFWWLVVLYAAYLVNLAAQVREQLTRRVGVILGLALGVLFYLTAPIVDGEPTMMLLVPMAALTVVGGVCILIANRLGRAGSLTVTGQLAFLVLTPPTVFILSLVLFWPRDTTYAQDLKEASLIAGLLIALTAPLVQRMVNHLRSLPR